MDKPYPQKKLTGQDAEFILNIKSSDIGKDLCTEIFGHGAKIVDGKFVKIPPRFNVYDKIDVPPGRYANNKQVIHTNVGMLIYFKLFFEEELSDIIKIEDYVNLPAIDGGTIGKIEDILSNALLTDKITSKQFINFLNKQQWFFTIACFMNSSMSEKTAKPLQDVMAEKKKLFKQHKKELDAGDSVVAAKIEKELLAKAKKELSDDYGMDIYNSGANASFGNNYKAMFVMKGPIKDNMTGETNVIGSNYSDGMEKEDLHSHFDSLVYGAYSKGVGTQQAGYLTKKFLAAYQSVVLDKKGTDCGTKLFYNIPLNSFNKKLFLYQYILVNGKYVLLDDSNIDSYVGKTVKMRLPGGCVGDKICNRCAGEMFYMLGNKNIGLTTFVASGALLRKSMKKFHDTSVKLKRVNIDDVIL